MLNSTVSVNSSEVLNASEFTKILDSTNASQSYVTEISNSANTLDPSESLNVTGSADTVYSETSQILDASVVVNSS
jgi:phage anti-repressor protein